MKNLIRVLSFFFASYLPMSNVNQDHTKIKSITSDECKKLNGRISSDIENIDKFGFVIHIKDSVCKEGEEVVGHVTGVRCKCLCCVEKVGADWPD